MCDSVLQSIVDVESFNMCVSHLKECALGVVLLGPEGYTSSKLPARLDAEVVLRKILRVGVELDIPRSLMEEIQYLIQVF